MPFPEKPRALVTGGGSGLGRALCLELARRGGRVLIADVNLAGAEETAAEVRTAGGEAFAVHCDVAAPASFEQAIAAADERLGGLDILVNNAGVAVSGPVGDVPLADWDWIVGINLMGVVHGCHLVAPRFKAAGRGFVLNVASAAGLVSSQDMAPYNATKAAVVALSETLLQEVRPHGVQVSVLCPTFFKTQIVKNARAHGDVKITHVASKLMEKSTTQAPEVARFALDGLERGELYLVPMADGRWMWRMKRLSPALFYGTLAPKAQRWMLKRMKAQLA